MEFVGFFGFIEFIEFVEFTWFIGYAVNQNPIDLMKIQNPTNSINPTHTRNSNN